MNPEIKIYGPIGGDSDNAITVKTISDQLEAIGAVDEIDVLINSDGGSVSQGIGIAKVLKKHPAKIHTIVQGNACSIAGYLACCGDRRTIEKDSIFHIHGPRIGTEGNLNDHEKNVELLKIATNSMSAVYSELSGQSPDEIAELFKDENFYSAEDAVSIGYFHEVGDSNAMAALIDTKKTPVPDKFATMLARRSEPNPREIDDMSKTPASLDDLEAKLKGASAEFLVAQLKAKASIDEAKDNFINQLQAEKKELQAKVDETTAETDEEPVAMEEEEVEASGVTLEEIAAALKSLMEPESEYDAEAMDDEEEVEAMDDDEMEAMSDDEEPVAMDDEEITAELLEKIAARLGTKPKAKAKRKAKKQTLTAKAGTRTMQFSGAKAIRKSTTNASSTARMTATAHVQKLVADQMTANGKLKKHEAIRNVFKSDPKLHQRYVSEANSSR